MHLWYPYFSISYLLSKKSELKSAWLLSDTPYGGTLWFRYNRAFTEKISTPPERTKEYVNNRTFTEKISTPPERTKEYVNNRAFTEKISTPPERTKEYVNNRAFTEKISTPPERTKEYVNNGVTHQASSRPQQYWFVIFAELFCLLKKVPLSISKLEKKRNVRFFKIKNISLTF